MPRATPLSPEARRASIIAATLPLLRIHGRAITTSQIAMAAGIAEGTLFRVFPDKESLIAAAIASAIDTAPAEAELARIDRSLSLRDQLVTAVEILQRRIGQVWQLISMLRIPVGPAAACRPQEPPDDTRIRELLAGIFEAHRDEIRCDSAQATRLLRALAVAGTHPRLVGAPLTPHEVVSLLLDGIRARDEEA